MFEGINFIIKQLQRTKKALQRPELAGFAPDGKSLNDVTGILSGIGSTKANVIALDVALRKALGGQEAAAVDVHASCVSAYANMRSIYRNDLEQVRGILRIPKRDQTPVQTLERANLTAEVWSKLPKMPGTQNDFKVGVLTLADFNLDREHLRQKTEAAEGADSDYKTSLDQLTRLQMDLGSFASAVVAQGRAQFSEGTPARAWIETIPLEQSTEAPKQAVISSATSPEAGAVRLVFGAEHATSFTVKEKMPGGTEFQTVAEEFTEEVYEDEGLSPGVHEFIVIPHNSRGTGPASAVAQVTVVIAVAA